jgi:hypothetical protein
MWIYYTISKLVYIYIMYNSYNGTNQYVKSEITLKNSGSWGLASPGLLPVNRRIKIKKKIKNNETNHPTRR